jgi:hypothetical protein
VIDEILMTEGNARQYGFMNDTSKKRRSEEEAWTCFKGNLSTIEKYRA